MKNILWNIPFFFFQKNLLNHLIMTNYSMSIVYNIGNKRKRGAEVGQTVYLDLFFLINFSMDFLCFYLSGTLLGSKLSVMRMVLGAVLGGIYADLTLFLPVDGIAKVAVHIGVCVLMCFAVFGRRSVAAHTCVYIATSAVLGGFMTALFELLNSMDIPLGEVESDGISAWMLLLLAVVSAIITFVGARFFRRKSARRYIDVTLDICGKRKVIKGFCDSGNLLCDPIGGKPCIIADKAAVADIMPCRVEELTSDRISDLDTDTAKRIRLIPAKTATGQGMLVAIRMDSICLDERAVNALLVLSELGENDGCEALVPCELLE